jgi:hypothetical protein
MVTVAVELQEREVLTYHVLSFSALSWILCTVLLAKTRTQQLL